MKRTLLIACFSAALLGVPLACGNTELMNSTYMPPGQGGFSPGMGEAVGTGTYQVDACHLSCAAGPVYPVAAVVTFSQPVKACSASGTRWFWSRASFRFPNGLPKALQGQNAPQNPWTFTTLVAAARQSCG